MKFQFYILTDGHPVRVPLQVGFPPVRRQFIPNNTTGTRLGPILLVETCRMPSSIQKDVSKAVIGQREILSYSFKTDRALAIPAKPPMDQSVRPTAVVQRMMRRLT